MPARLFLGPAVTIPAHGVKGREHLRMSATIATFAFSPGGNEAMVKVRSAG